MFLVSSSLPSYLFLHSPQIVNLFSSKGHFWRVSHTSWNQTNYCPTGGHSTFTISQMHSSLPFQFATWNKTGEHSRYLDFVSLMIHHLDILQLPQIRSTTFWNSTNASPFQSYITLEVVESGNGTRSVRTIFEGWLFARSIVRLRLDFPSSPMFLFRDIF